MIPRKTVAVIGGGVSGLAAAKAFDKRGHRVPGLERSHDFGGVWQLSRSYADVQTQSPKDLSRYTDLSMPDGYPEWAKGPQVLAHLLSYAARHTLARLFRPYTRMPGMDRRADGKPGWTLTIDEAGSQRQEDFDFVAICTGRFFEKTELTFAGQAAFVAAGGQVLRSSDDTDASAARGRHKAVPGGSKSATDIAVNATRKGAASVTMIYRENVWRVPYCLGGINFKRLLYMRAQEQQFNAWGKSLLQRVIAAALKSLVWANFRGFEARLTLQLGLGKWNIAPDHPIEKTVSCSLPTVTPGLFQALNARTLRAVRGTYDHCGPGQIVLSTGETLPCDLSVMAVGWNLGVPVIPKPYRQKLIDEDGQSRVCRLSVNPDLPNMGFVGFNSSFCTVLSAEMIASWLVRYADGQLAHQPTDAVMRVNIDRTLAWKSTERPAAQVYGGLCSAPFHFKHFDELPANIGATRRKRANPLAEQFGYPDAAAYGSFLASAPQYRAG